MNGRQINMILKRLWEIEARAVEITKIIEPENDKAILEGNLKLNLALCYLTTIEKETNKLLNIFKGMDK